MAFTSFTVRNTISNNGSSLRRTNVTQDSSTPDGSGNLVYDSGLRADGFFIPVPESFLESTFEANVYNRTEIELNWDFGFTIVETPGASPEPVEVLIKASVYGEPITAGDGDTVISVTYANYTLAHTDSNSLYVKEGNWVYYSMFVRYEDSTGDAFYERVATLSIQIPRNFNSTEDLWSRIPTHYRGLDAEYAANTADYPYENGPLYRYIELFGWELDKIRTTVYDTMRINDPEVVHSSAIDALANQTGIEFTKEALGTSKLRAVLNNIGYLRRTKGTLNSIESYISALSGCGVTTTFNFGVTEFNVHPMRVNLITDPFFSQAETGPSTPDTGDIQRKFAALNAGGREYGWGVYADFSAVPPSSITVSTTGEKLTVTLPAMSGTVILHVYSRGEFNYNNNLRYYYSALSSHDFTPRFITAYELPSIVEGSFPGPAPLTYFDSWNDSVTTFPKFKDFLTSDSRKIVSSIPSATTVIPSTVIPVYKFDITLSASSPTVVTFEKPLIEYKNSGGDFFSGDEPLGGFIQDPTGAPGAGAYDYHWGINAGSVTGTDFSYYTLDYKRVQTVVDNVIENYIVPVTIVKNTDYVINWDVLE